MDAVLSMALSVLNTRIAGERALSSGYCDVLQVQLETVHRRQAIGSAVPGLDAFAAQIAAEVASGDMPAAVAEVFAEARRRLGTRPSDARHGARDADLDRLIARIQALRAKTVEQGCTEAEALAAAEKVAELLDRYGLSLSELDLEKPGMRGRGGRNRAQARCSGGRLRAIGGGVLRLPGMGREGRGWPAALRVLWTARRRGGGALPV